MGQQPLGKPDVPLVDHLRDVLLLGDHIARRLGLEKRLRMQALLACALHDIGKATRSFQEYMQAARALEEAKARGATDRDLQNLQSSVNKKKKAAYPHALASLPLVLIAERHLAKENGWEPHRLSATGAVLTHHSPLGPELYQGYSVPDLDHPALFQAIEAVWALLEQVGIGPLPPARQLLHHPLIKLSPSAILRQTLPDLDQGRSTSLLGLLQQQPVEEFAQVKTVLHLADWLASAKRQDVSVFFLSGGGRRIADYVSPFRLRQFQRQAGETGDDVLWLRAPTGTGKTEALLLWAGDTERLLYLLPTQATVNAMWQRLKKVYGEEEVGLAHGRASYMLRQEADQDSLDARLFGSVFARPVTVATLDQYILAHLHGRHWEERRTLARQATIVVDEVHTYEPYTLGLLLAALEREQPARLAVASATLPTSLLQLFPKGKLIDAEPELWQRARHRLKLHDSPLDSCVDEVVAAARDGQRVLVVANTVRQAQELYRIIKSELGPSDVHLLHSRFTFRDRQRKERQAESPAPGTVFIATQVVEVSLDISYDVLFTEVAPMDALVQRMGRVNRRGDRPPAPVHLFCQPSEGAQHIYGRHVLERSLQLVRALPSIPTDAELVEATHQLYQWVTATVEWQKDLQAGRDTLREVQSVQGCYTIDLSDPEMRQRFTARRGHITVEVLPCIFRDEAYAFKDSGEGWRLPELLVPVPIYWFRQQPSAFTPLKDLGCYQTTLPYDPELGLCPPDGESEASFALLD